MSGNTSDVFVSLLVKITSRSDLFFYCKPIGIEENIMTLYGLFVLETLVHLKCHVLSLFECRSNVCNCNTRNKSSLDVPVGLKKLQTLMYIKLR